MLTRAQGRAQRRHLMKEIAREDRKKKKLHLVSLRTALRDARDAHRRAIAHAIDRCRTARLHARARVSELRAKAFQELREAVEIERAAARKSCGDARSSATDKKGARARARAELLAEQQFRREMRRIEKSAKERHRDLVAKQRRHEKRRENDDEVRGNIPPELVHLFNRVRTQIKATPHRSRTEAFLDYAEDHPNDVLAAIEDKTEAAIRELERQETQARRRLTRAELAELVPF